MHELIYCIEKFLLGIIQTPTFNSVMNVYCRICIRIEYKNHIIIIATRSQTATLRA